MLSSLLQGEQAKVILCQPPLWEALFSCTTPQLTGTEQSAPFSPSQGGAPTDRHLIPPTEAGGLKACKSPAH